MEKISTSDQDQRAFYRIEDQVVFDYYLLNSSEIASDNPLASDQPIMQLQKITHALRDIDSESRALFAEISRRSPNISEYLYVLNKKIEVISHFLTQDLLAKFLFKADCRPEESVNLSAGGLAFVNQTALPIGTTMQCKLILKPKYECLLMKAEVVACTELTDPTADLPAFRIAINFNELSEADEEILVRHIFQRQLAQRKELTQ